MLSPYMRHAALMPFRCLRRYFAALRHSRHANDMARARYHAAAHALSHVASATPIYALPLLLLRAMPLLVVIVFG